MDDNTKILGHSLEEWGPEPPNVGPPLPIWLGPYLPLDGYWPWYHKGVVPVGPANFTIKVANLPEGATNWNCAFKDPNTGIWYQATNRPITPGFTLPGPDDVNDFSTPVSGGILSISAYEGSGGSSDAGVILPVQLASYQITVSVKDGVDYTFDFNTQKLS